jgi:riboflavin kinase/FMN adenylyltransferase
MKVAYNVNDLKIGASVATIGNFDGVHLGHREIISRVLDAKGRVPGSSSLLITFNPHPADLLYPSRNLSLLTDMDKKLEILEGLGLDAVLIIEFTLAFAKQDPRDFVSDVLLPLNVRELFIGHDFAFGKGRSGNVDFLVREGKRFGFAVHEVEQITMDGERIGSSRVRELIEKGDVEQAAKLLGRSHSLRGEVVKGAGRGKPLGFPTCNIHKPEETTPSPGVYATRTIVKGVEYDSATHVGRVPTFDQEEFSLETHIFGFDGDARGERIEVMFIKKLRDTAKYSSVEELVRQIKIDCDAAKDALAKYGRR